MEKRDERQAIPLQKDLHRRFKLYCVENGLIMSKQLSFMIEKFLDEKK